MCGLLWGLGVLAVYGGSAQAYEVSQETLYFDGQLRTYSIFVPDDLPAGPVAMVVTLHGGEDDAETANYFHFEGKWMELAQLNKFILLLPEGRPDPSGDGGHNWNDCRSTVLDPEAESTADDVAFIDALIETVESQYSIDPLRIYANGYSNGGLMVYRLADQLRYRFAAVAAAIASMPLDSECPDTALPIPILIMNGTADTYVPFHGGAIGGSATGSHGSVMPSWDTVRHWSYVNGIESSPSARLLPDKAPDDASRVTLYTYSGGLNNSEILFYVVDGGGHTVPGPTPIQDPATSEMLGPKNHDIVAAYEMWNFFSRHTLTRTAGNAAPLPVNDGPLPVAKDGLGVTCDVLANDGDPTGDPLRVVAVTQAVNGLASILPDGRTVSYEPNEGYVGTDSFDYRVTDGRGNIATARVTVAVRANAVPVAKDQTWASKQGKPVAFTLSGTDADGDKLSMALCTTPANGVLAGTMPSYTYYPKSGYTGSDSFEFVVYDVYGGKDTGIVTFNVTANAVPVAKNLSLTSVRGQAVTFTLSATDADGDAVTLALKSIPTHGLLSGSIPKFTYYPTSGYAGSDRFEFVAYDALGGIGTGVVSIAVTANSVPVAINQSLSTWMNTSVSVKVSATDADGDVLTYALSKAPINGTVGGTCPNFIYYPKANFVGTDSFQFKAWDASGGIATGTISITVKQPAPIVLSGTGLKVSGVPKTDLVWTGINSPSVKIYRNGVLVASPSNTGSYRDAVNKVGTWKYVVVEPTTGRKSNEITIRF